MNTQTQSRKKILYVDMDNVLVDFPHGIECLGEEDKAKYAGNYDECPNIFSLMRPLPGAIESFHTLSKVFDTYILSTAPWKNSSAWNHKIEWVQKHFGSEKDDPAHKRLILSHHKNLNRGDFLIDDRPNNGAAQFEGEWIQFGSEKFPDWKIVTRYLLDAAAKDEANSRNRSNSVVQEEIKGDVPPPSPTANAAATLEDAIAIAALAHKGQTDKAKACYIHHPLRLMMKMNTEAEMMTAILHDVVEDSYWTFEKLREAGFPDEVIDALDGVTKREGESYEDFIKRSAANPISRRVKIADLEDNLNILRIGEIQPKYLARIEKYHRSWKTLTGI